MPYTCLSCNKNKTKYRLKDDSIVCDLCGAIHKAEELKGVYNET